MEYRSCPKAIERFDIRLPANAKQMLMQAAEMSGNTLTGLILNAAMDKARYILQSHQHFRLNAEDWGTLHSIPWNIPPNPTRRCATAWRDYRDAGLE